MRAANQPVFRNILHFEQGGKAQKILLSELQENDLLIIENATNMLGDNCFASRSLAPLRGMS